MKVKLDENLGTAGAEFLKAAGFDVATVTEQQLTSAPDERLAKVCAAEGRCLVTLDKDFSDPLRIHLATTPASWLSGCRAGSSCRCWNRPSVWL